MKKSLFLTAFIILCYFVQSQNGNLIHPNEVVFSSLYYNPNHNIDVFAKASAANKLIKTIEKNTKFRILSKTRSETSQSLYPIYEMRVFETKDGKIMPAPHYSFGWSKVDYYIYMPLNQTRFKILNSNLSEIKHFDFVKKNNDLTDIDLGAVAFTCIDDQENVCDWVFQIGNSKTKYFAILWVVYYSDNVLFCYRLKEPK